MLLCVLPLQAQKTTPTWKQVDESITKELPRTTVEVAQRLFDEAQRKGNVPEMMKAYMTLTEAKCQLSRDSITPCCNYLRAWIAREKHPVHRAVLQNLLGGLLMDATKHPSIYTASDLNEEGWQLMKQSLQPNDTLLQTPARAYEALLLEGKTDQRYGGDKLYPLLIRRTLRAMVNSDEFRPVRYDELPKVVGALYPPLEDFYQSGGATELLVLALAEHAETYEEDFPIDRLSSLIQQYNKVETCAELYYLLAQRLSDDRPAVAYDTLQSALKRYPKYERIGRLQNLSLQLLQPSLSLSLPKFYPGRPVRLKVNYRNVTHFKLHLYRLNTTRFLCEDSYDWESSNRWKKLATEVETYDYTLEPTTDFRRRERTLSLTIPEEGYYVMRTEQLDSYSGMVAVESLQFFTVSSIDLVELPFCNGRSVLMVVDNLTGAPVPQASVEIYREGDADKEGEPMYELVETLSCDARGLCERTYQKEVADEDLFGRAVAGDHLYMTPVSLNDRNILFGDLRDSRLNLFTDRSIYRPGQTVHVVALYHTSLNDTLTAEAGQEVEIQLLNNDRTQVASQKATTNEFGSCAVDFRLPEEGTVGRYYLVATAGKSRRTEYNLRVEEYRRPQFNVKVDPLTDSYCWKDTLRLTGCATFLNGAPVPRAKVHYFVGVGAWRSTQSLRERPNCSGEVTTDEAGRYTILFPTEKCPLTDHPGSIVCKNLVEVTSEGGDTETVTQEIGISDRPARLRLQSASDTWLKEQPSTLQVTLQNYNQQSLRRALRYELFAVPGEADWKGNQVVVKMLEGSCEGAWGPVVREIQQLPSGRYKLRVSLTERGVLLSDSLEIRLASVKEGRLPKGFGELLVSQVDVARGVATVYYGTSRPNPTMLVNYYTRSGELRSWTETPGDSIRTFETPLQAAKGEGVFSYAFVQEGQLYSKRDRLTLPAVNSKLHLRWSSFRDQLRAGSREEWRLCVTDAQGNPVDAELFATLYDASLDQLCKPNPWMLNLRYIHRLSFAFYDYDREGFSLRDDWRWKQVACPSLTYHTFTWPAWNGRRRIHNTLYSLRGSATTGEVRLMSRASAASAEDAGEEEPLVNMDDEVNENLELVDRVAKRYDVPLRQQFAEDAFFFPQLRSDAHGEIALNFTLPESLTSWHFRALAHTKEMAYGRMDTLVVASKPFMLQARLPRAVRVGDRPSLDATLFNQTDVQQVVKVRMELSDAATKRVVYTARTTVKLPANGSSPVAFPCEIKTYTDSLTCRMVAENDVFSDGEQHALPVLSDREPLTESVLVGLRKSGTKQVSLRSLFNRHSATATQRRLVVEYTGKPEWLAVAALPTLQHPSENDALSLAAACYAETLAQWLVTLHPEMQQEASLAELLDAEKVEQSIQGHLNKLSALQLPNGCWTWFKGMPASRYVTTAVMEMLARSTYIASPVQEPKLKRMMQQGFDVLKVMMQSEWKSQSKKDKEFSEAAAHYLYIFALLQRDLNLKKSALESQLFDVVCAQRSELTLYGKARLSVIDQLMGEGRVAPELLQSLLEYAVESEELGRYYETDKAQRSWMDDRIPTQAAVVEAFARYGYAPDATVAMQQWILKQKQVQAWLSPLHTVDAVWALLMGREEALAEVPMPELKLDKKVLDTSHATSGQQLFREERSYADTDPLPATFTVTQQHDGLTWGAVFAQYQEVMDSVQSQGEALQVERTLYVARLRNGATEWEEVRAGTALQVGDLLKSEIRLLNDRTLSFVQLRHLRAGCLEPKNNLSGYGWNLQDRFYQSVRDHSDDFYFEQLPKGEHRLELYSRVTREGDYSAGVVKVQCLYNPAFNAHTAGNLRLKVER
jgi:hypothetical protein